MRHTLIPAVNLDRSCSSSNPSLLPADGTSVIAVAPTRKIMNECYNSVFLEEPDAFLNILKVGPRDLWMQRYLQYLEMLSEPQLSLAHSGFFSFFAC